MAKESLVLREYGPRIALYGAGLSDLRQATIEEVGIEDGFLAVNKNSTFYDSLTEAQVKSAILASLGLTNEQVSEATHTHRGTVKKHLGDVFDELGLNKPDNFIRIDRNTLPRYLLSAGVYCVRQACQPIGLSPAETAAIDLVSTGHTNTEIASLCMYSLKAITRRLERVATRLNWEPRDFSVRTALAATALLSGEVGFSPPIVIPKFAIDTQPSVRTAEAV